MPSCPASSTLSLGSEPLSSLTVLPSVLVWSTVNCVRSRHCLYCLSGWNAYYGGIFYPEGTGNSQLQPSCPLPIHPYRDFGKLNQLLLDNGLIGINVQNLADCLKLIVFYRDIGSGPRGYFRSTAAMKPVCREKAVDRYLHNRFLYQLAAQKAWL